MDREGLTAILTVILLASAAVGSPHLRWRWKPRDLTAALDVEEQKRALPPPGPAVDIEPFNEGTVAPGGGPPPSLGASTGNPTPPPGSELKPQLVSVNSSAPPASPSSESPSRSPPPPPLQPPPQAPSLEGPPPPPAPGSPPGGPAEPSPSGAGNKAPPEGWECGGGGEQSGNGSEVVDKRSGVIWKCSGNVMAYFCYPEIDNKDLSILVRNNGNNPVVVEVSSVGIGPITVAKNAFKKIKLPSNVPQSPVILKVGGKSCLLASTPLPLVDAFLQQLPAYATPVYGVYAFFFTALVAGGTWAFCKCRKRSRTVDSRVSYQQLEMGAHDVTSAVETNGRGGWDQGWDDDWEDEEAGPRPKELSHGGGVSANGNATIAISSKPSVRDEWEDWDD